MAFQFPDPTETLEFTAANGITYSWGATDGKWVVKGFPDGSFLRIEAKSRAKKKIKAKAYRKSLGM